MTTKPKWQSYSLRRNIRSISPIKLLITLLLLAFLIWMVVWFWQNYERVEKIDYEPNNRVSYNPYYAAELLINSQNTNNQDNSDVDSGDYVDIAYTDLDSDLKLLIDNLPEIDPQSPQRPTLLINSIGGTLTPERFEKLRAWIEQGGHVITFSQNEIAQEDLDELLNRLQVLKQQATQNFNNQNPNENEKQKNLLNLVNNDAEFNAKLNELGSNNQLLLRLGIFAIAQLEDGDDENDSEEDITKEVEEAAQKEMQKVIQDKKVDTNKPQDLLDDLNFIFKSMTPLTIKEGDDGNAIIMVQTDTADIGLDSEVFKQLYSNEHSLYSSIDDKTQAQLIRKYLRQQLVVLQNAYEVDIQSIKDDIDASNNDNNNQGNSSNSLDHDNNPDVDKDKASQSTTADDESKDNANNDDSSQEDKLTEILLAEMLGKQNIKEDATYLAKLLTVAIALDDQELLQIFTPAKQVLFDSSLGQGRISVIIDNKGFTNPDPNIDLKENDMTTANQSNPFTKINGNPLDAPLLSTVDWLGPRINLASMDNALWLLSLTNNSSQVIILPNTDIDPLPVMLWKHARLAILGGLLLALIWLWSLYNRFGKIQQLDDHQAHDILRYFQQVGQYGWKYDNAVKLSKSTQQQVHKLLQQHLAQLVNGKSLSKLSELLEPNSQTKSSTTTLDQAMNNLQQLLSKRLDEQFKFNTKEQQDVDGFDKALQHNKQIVQQAISIARLQAAVSPILSALLSEITADDETKTQAHKPTNIAKQLSNNLGNETQLNATEFTKITQTLWVVQWLLK